MATLTLKNVPDKLYERLKEDARRNRRSLNQEAIAQLERSEAKRSREEAWASAQAGADRMAARGVSVDPEDVVRWIREGRK